MAKNFYKYDGSYYEQGTNTKIADLASLQNYAKAGGTEIQYAPDASWQKIANPDEIKNYDVKGQFGSTLYGVAKQQATPTTASPVPEPAAPTMQSLYVDTALKSANETQVKLAQAKADQLAKNQQEQADLKQQKADIETRRQTEVIEPYKEATTPFREGIENKYNNQFEVERQIQQSIDLADDIVTYSNLLTEELNAAGAKTGWSVTARNAKTNNIKDTYVSRIATAQAAQAAISGNISLVYTHIDRAINAITADRNDQLQYLDFVNSTLNTQSADINAQLFTLSTDEKESMASMEADIRAEITRIEGNKDTMIGLLSDPNTAVAAHKAGIQLTDTPEEAALKLNDYYVNNPQELASGVTFEKVGEDENGGAIYGFVDTANQTIKPFGQTASTPLTVEGAYGGQCGDYLHKIMDGTPTFGDTWQSKQAAMNISAEEFKASPQVGDIVAFKTNLPYGHVAVVNAINSDGTFTVTESNYGLDQKVGTSRKVNINNSNILGAYRGAKLKTPETNKFTPKFYSTDYGQKVLNNEQQYQTNFLSQPVVKEFVSTQNKASTVAKIIEAGVGGPGDLAIVFEFMKGLDPTSVVRESEYDAASKSGNIFSGIFAKFNGYLKPEGGVLPENVKAAFKDIVNAKLEIYQRQYNQMRDEFRRTASEQDLNPEHVAPNLVISFDTEPSHITGLTEQDDIKLSDEDAYRAYLKIINTAYTSK